MSRRRSLIPIAMALALAACAVMTVFRSEPITYATFWTTNAQVHSVSICRLDPNPEHATRHSPFFRIGRTEYLITRAPAMMSKESHIELLRLLRDNRANPSPIQSACLLSPGVGCIFFDRTQHELGRLAICLHCSDWLIGGEQQAQGASFYDLHDRVLACLQEALPGDDDIKNLKPRTKYQR